MVHYKNTQDLGYTDFVEYDYGGMAQYVLFGDPDLRMLSPTLLLQTTWSYPESGGNLTITMIVRDQDGAFVAPDTLEVSLGTQVLMPKLQSPGVYTVEWTPSGLGQTHELVVKASKSGYVSSKGGQYITRHYDLYVPKLVAQPGQSVYYTGDWAQTLDMSVNASLPSPYDTALAEYNTNYLRALVRNATGVIWMTLNLGHDTGGTWLLSSADVSSLPEGTYNVSLGISAKYWPYLEVLAGNFTVEHVLKAVGPVVTYNGSTKAMDIKGLQITSSYTPHGILGPTEVTIAEYAMMVYNGGYTEAASGWSGDLGYDVSKQEFVLSMDLIDLPLGEYYVRVTIATAYAGPMKVNSSRFSQTEGISLNEPSLAYTGGMVQTLRIFNVTATQVSGRSEVVPAAEVISALYSLHLAIGEPAGPSGDLIWMNGTWEAELNVSDMSEGDHYYIEVLFSTLKWGNASASSHTFMIQHVLTCTEPMAIYNDYTKTVKVYNLSVASSFHGAAVIGGVLAQVHSYMVFPGTEGGTPSGLWGNLTCVSGEWGGLVDVSSLQGGPYRIECIFGYRGKTVQVSTRVFTVTHQIRVQRPMATFETARDTLSTTGIRPISSNTLIGALTPSTATKSQVRVLDATGKAVISDYLEYNTSGGYFFKEFANISTQLSPGFYTLEVTFAALNHQGEFSNASRPVNITVTVTGDDDDDISDDDTNTSMAYLVTLVVTVVLLALLVAVVAFYYVPTTRRNMEEKSTDALEPEVADGSVFDEKTAEMVAKKKGGKAGGVRVGPVPDKRSKTPAGKTSPIAGEEEALEGPLVSAGELEKQMDGVAVPNGKGKKAKVKKALKPVDLPDLPEHIEGPPEVEIL